MFTSLKVDLAVIFKDENLGDEMIDIMRELHEKVPVMTEPDGNEVFD